MKLTTQQLLVIITQAAEASIDQLVKSGGRPTGSDVTACAKAIAANAAQVILSIEDES